MENNTEETKVILKKDRKVWVREQLLNIWDLVKFIALALIIVIPIRTYIAQPFIVSGESMVPTFQDGQYLIVDEISYRMGHVNRGDVVIFKYPHDTSRYFIKRIIGLPGEQIEISGKSVKITNKENPLGFTLSEPYINEDFITNEKYNTGPDEYFVMGDNRNRSADSRSWGVVNKKFLIGRAYLRLLPFNSIDYLPGEYKEEK
ncbi:MAG: signal peptidase I [Candidatus Pacebacteria bacterium]|nr:signal peptidase I [Candidatus Paceibacterota bacterium]MBP9715635.1 signal peptidase I [Candidatus Paceibacterota bacterium]